MKTVTTGYAVSPTDQVVLADATGLPSPTGLTVTPQSSGGTFAARSAPNGYYWSVTATNGSTESAALVTAAARPIVAGGSAILSWNAVPGATGYRIFRGQFSDPAHPTAFSEQLVASVGSVTTYTDTGGSTASQNPPSANGAAFTITLPDATTYLQAGLQIKAIGDTPNLVTLAPVGGQTIDGSSTISLGQVAGADYQGVTLLTDGANWFVAQCIPVPLTVAQAAGLSTTATPNGGSFAGGYTALAVVAIPTLGFGQRFKATWATQFLAAASTTEVIFQVCFCKSDGTFVGYNASGPGWLNGTQLGYWYVQNFTPGQWVVESGEWLYLPRPGDFNVEGGWGPYSRYLGLYANLVGGNGKSTFASSKLSVEAGAVSSTYFGPS